MDNMKIDDKKIQKIEKSINKLKKIFLNASATQDPIKSLTVIDNLIKIKKELK